MFPPVEYMVSPNVITYCTYIHTYTLVRVDSQLPYSYSSSSLVLTNCKFRAYLMSRKFERNFASINFRDFFSVFSIFLNPELSLQMESLMTVLKMFWPNYKLKKTVNRRKSASRKQDRKYFFMDR